MRPAWRAREEAALPAWPVTEEAMRPAWPVTDEAMRPARRVREEALRAATATRVATEATAIARPAQPVLIAHLATTENGTTTRMVPRLAWSGPPVPRARRK